jgi:ribose 5-phosphate isomerase RpiB
MLRETGHGVIDFGDGPPKLDDDMNMICLGGLVVGHSLAWKLAETFLEARYKNVERHRRRLDKVAQLEHTEARS